MSGSHKASVLLFAAAQRSSVAERQSATNQPRCSRKKRKGGIAYVVFWLAAWLMAMLVCMGTVGRHTSFRKDRTASAWLAHICVECTRFRQGIFRKGESS
jgi:hypothetical protein